MDALNIIITSGISSVLGITTALITTNHKMRKQYHLEKQKEKDKIRIKYLSPLLVASLDLVERMIDISERRKNIEKRNNMLKWFKEIKTNNRADKKRFAFWANDEGYFAMSTLYVTAVYFYYASKIRRELPFIEFRSGDDRAFLDHISKVRTAIGGKYGIWETIQDSLGTYMDNKEKDTVKNYRQFCQLIIDQSEFIWFNRLIDFYKDIHQKIDDHINSIILSLKSLIKFLSKNMNLKIHH